MRCQMLQSICQYWTRSDKLFAKKMTICLNSKLCLESSEQFEEVRQEACTLRHSTTSRPEQSWWKWKSGAHKGNKILNAMRKKRYLSYIVLWLIFFWLLLLSSNKTGLMFFSRFVKSFISSPSISVAFRCTAYHIPAVSKLNPITLDNFYIHVVKLD